MFSHLSSFYWGSIRHWRTAAVAYVIQLGLALTLGMQVYEVFKSSIGHSLNLERLLASYDHTVMTDFLKVHGASITPLIGQLRWMLIVWMFFSVFINGGLLFAAVNRETPTIGKFWQGGSRYYLPFLTLALYAGVATIIWTTLIWGPAFMNLQWALEYFTTEKVALWAVCTLMLLYLTGLAGLYVWSVAARLEIIQGNASIKQGIISSWLLVRKYWRAILRVLLISTCLQLCLLALFWVMDGFVGMRSGLGILIMFLTQQSLAYLRILLRAGLYQGIQQLRSRT